MAKKNQDINKNNESNESDIEDFCPENSNFRRSKGNSSEDLLRDYLQEIKRIKLL